MLFRSSSLYIIVMDKDQYTLKVNDFINNNNIEMIQVYPTPQFVKILNNIINRSTNINVINIRRKHTSRAKAYQGSSPSIRRSAKNP